VKDFCDRIGLLAEARTFPRQTGHNSGAPVSKPFGELNRTRPVCYGD
jgi:hypothetical protein